MKKINSNFSHFKFSERWKNFVEEIHDFLKKELSFNRKLRFSNPYILETQCRRLLIFQTMNSVKSNNLLLK